MGNLCMLRAAFFIEEKLKVSEEGGENKEKGKRKKCRKSLNAILNTLYTIRAKDAVSRRFFGNSLDGKRIGSYNI